MVRPIRAVWIFSPVKGISRMNRASEGMVNRTPVKPRIGPYSRGQRTAARASEQQGQAGELDVLDQVAADVVEVVADPRPADQLGRQGRGGAVGQLISLDSSSMVTMPS
jgi:hypothetical protein